MVPHLSRRAARKLIKEGGVFLDGQRCMIASKRVCEGARLVLHFEAPIPPPPHRVLYEDDRFLAVDKPVGQQVNETETSRVRSLAEEVGAWPVHRLDRDTSGVVLLAKDKKAAEIAAAEFRDRKVKKTYLAVCVGSLHDQVIEAPIGPDPRRPRARKVRPDGKVATTSVQVVGRRGDVLLVMATPVTGRTHQIRVHLAHCQAPILGDLLYGGPAAVRIGSDVLRSERVMLHAYRLNVRLTQDVVQLEAPLPSDFVALSRHGLAFDLGSV